MAAMVSTNGPTASIERKMRIELENCDWLLRRKSFSCCSSRAKDLMTRIPAKLSCIVTTISAMPSCSLLTALRARLPYMLSGTRQLGKSTRVTMVNFQSM